MSGVPYWHVDAFTRAAFGGNQAAVMLLENWPEDTLLQVIAAENAFAETAFLVPGRGAAADWELRWFTPAMEVRLCGHATLASGHVILAGDEERDFVRFRTREAGVLEVRRDGERYELSLPSIDTSRTAWPAAVAALGAEPLETWRSDQGYTVFLYAGEAQVRELDPDMRALAALGTDLFIATAPGEDCDVTSRVFVPGAGVDEDSATGSAHAALTPFWCARLGRDSFSAFQASRRGADFACRLEGERAILGGGCVTVVEGTFYF